MQYDVDHHVSHFPSFKIVHVALDLLSGACFAVLSTLERFWTMFAVLPWVILIMACLSGCPALLGAQFAHRGDCGGGSEIRGRAGRPPSGGHRRASVAGRGRAERAGNVAASTSIGRYAGNR